MNKPEDFIRQSKRYGKLTLGGMFDKLDALQKENDRLREALGKYGRHDKSCSVTGAYEYQCNCGFMETLIALNPPTEGDV